jgi:glycosyltransferase involved in cell wall biosynthesis
MRVLLITGSFPPMKCGVGDYSYSLAKALITNQKVCVGVLTSELGDLRGKVAGIEVFPIIKRWRLSEIMNVIKIIHSWSPDIVHIQYPTQGYGNGFLPWVLPIILFFMKKKVVQTWHELYPKRDVFKLLLKSIAPSNLVFVNSQYEKNLHPYLKWALWRKKVIFIPNASAIPRLYFSALEKKTIKKKYLKKQSRLIIFFGFIYPHKGVELLFDIADPNIDHIVIAGEYDEKSSYINIIKQCASAKIWLGKVTFAGFLSPRKISALLGVADAVLLPFRHGSNEWNSSVHAAVLNGAFIITTSLTFNGYDKKSNIYFAKVDNIPEMKSALLNYAGERRKYHPDIDCDKWHKIANQHSFFYKRILAI